MELARNLHASGSPAYELDQRMETVAQSLGNPATFFSTPTAIFVSFESVPASTRLIRVYPVDVNLAKYANLYELQREIDEQSLPIAEAWRRLKEIEHKNDDYPTWLNIIAFGLAGSTIAVLVGGNVIAQATAGFIGLIIGIVVSILMHWKFPTHLVNVIAGFVAMMLTGAFHSFFPGGNVTLTVLSALVVLLPGLQLTVSVNELATQNLASGSARIAGAMTTLLTMIFGVVMGHGFISSLVKVPISAPPLTPDLYQSLLTLIPITLAFGILFRARVRDGFWMLLSTVIAFGSLSFARAFMGPLGAVAVAALIVGVSSNLFARWKGLPSAIMLMPGLLLLVPGSLGFFGMSAMLISDDFPGGFRLIVNMMLVTVSIVAGLLLAGVVFPAEPAASTWRMAESPAPLADERTKDNDK
ncbi:threonine/serine exporter family protein [Rhodopirellula sp. ICT_H3.1]|uniref:Threonine/serine exporter family protein n=1 Tax=Aporhodopirellula aestuarii TaxID=2950107 RepID=A0ABT0U1T0_9BACT|nr:threonine/serine exporter family protein [Aporhodopirellula aestuarii]